MRRTRRLSSCYRPGWGARGDLAPVQGHVLAWLQAHGADPSADFVLRRWLDAGGDLVTVQGHVLAWLQAHGADHSADFVLRRWLDVGGDLVTVQGHVLAWLQAHETDEKAQFVLSAWLGSRGRPGDGAGARAGVAGGAWAARDSMFRDGSMDCGVWHSRISEEASYRLVGGVRWQGQGVGSLRGMVGLRRRD